METAQWIDKEAHSAKGTSWDIMIHNSAYFYFMLGDGDSRADLTLSPGRYNNGKGQKS